MIGSGEGEDGSVKRSHQILFHRDPQQKTINQGSPKSSNVLLGGESTAWWGVWRKARINDCSQQELSIMEAYSLPNTQAPPTNPCTQESSTN